MSEISQMLKNDKNHGRQNELFDLNNHWPNLIVTTKATFVLFFAINLL